MATFPVLEDMEERLRKAMRKARRNKAIGTDGIPVEMLHVTPELRASLLHRWWQTAGRMGTFPEE